MISKTMRGFLATFNAIYPLDAATFQAGGSVALYDNIAYAGEA
jgi:hypothetical protein